MELDAEHGKRPMRQRHHEAVLASRDDAELRRERLLANHERMVSPGFERLRQSVEESGARVRDPRALAMARRRSPLDRAAMPSGDRLVTEAHAEKRHTRSLGFRNHRDRPPRPFGPAGPRRNHDGARPQRDDVRGLEAIVARDPTSASSLPSAWTRLKVKES